MSIDPRTLANVLALMRYVEDGLAAERSRYTSIVTDLRLVLARGGVASGCKRCGRPVERVRTGRPRLYCETCHKPRTKSTLTTTTRGGTE